MQAARNLARKRIIWCALRLAATCDESYVGMLLHEVRNYLAAGGEPGLRDLEHQMRLDLSLRGDA
jgi:hypothetical protein